jgi:hypothetical protein
MSILSRPHVVATPLAVALDRLSRYLDAESVWKNHQRAWADGDGQVTDLELARSLHWKDVAKLALEHATRRLDEQYFSARNRLVRWTEEGGLEVLRLDARHMGQLSIVKPMRINRRSPGRRGA